MKNKFFAAALLLILIFGGVFYGLSQNFSNGEPSNTVGDSQTNPGQPDSFRVVPMDTNLLIKPHSPIKGKTDAKVTVVEFLDPECEACGAMYPYVKKVLKEHEADVKLVIRYMPYHQNSMLVANILEGARAQGKYWEALEILFSTQDQWADHHNPKPDLIPELLADLKLDMKKIMTDAKNGKYDSQIREDQEDGKKLGVNGTPSFFVNGHPLPELGYESLKNAIVNSL